MIVFWVALLLLVLFFWKNIIDQKDHSESTIVPVVDEPIKEDTIHQRTSANTLENIRKNICLQKMSGTNTAS